MATEPNNLPDVPDSWKKFLERAILLISLLLNFYSGVMSSWNNVKLGGVQTHQEVNSVKLDDAKAEAAAAKIEAAETKQVVKKVDAKLDK